MDGPAGSMDGPAGSLDGPAIGDAPEADPAVDDRSLGGDAPEADPAVDSEADPDEVDNIAGGARADFRAGAGGAAAAPLPEGLLVLSAVDDDEVALGRAE